MLIGKDYKVESDSFNVTLYQRRISKKNQKEYWLAVGYFATVKNALKELADRELRETELKDFKAVVKRQDEIYGLIEGMK